MSSGDKEVQNNKLQELLNKLSMGEQLSSSQVKQMEDYKFWKTQPVASLNEKVNKEGPIDRIKTPDEIPDTTYPLIPEFEWVTMDINDKGELDEVYTLLYDNYVEDGDATFRFKYSHEFFNWALKPPGWKKEWHVGVRVKSSQKLVAFISAIPITLKLTESQKVIPSVEINFLCVHKKLRSKRLTPVLIKEITRRVNKHDIWQALYTAGIVLPSPMATCRYTHRPINWPKLHDVGFSHLPPNHTKSGMVAHYALPNKTTTPGLRKMKHSDIDQVFDLYNEYQKKFKVIQLFDKEEMEHWFLGGDSTDNKSNVIKAYVVENAEGKITDFLTYYLLPFTVLENPSHDELGIAYLFYYASDSIDSDNYKENLNSLVQDALITSKEYGVDVFNCLTSQDNPYFIKDLKFGSGDGYLNYYLFNYRTLPMHGGIDPITKEPETGKTSDVGVVLL